MEILAKLKNLLPSDKVTYCLLLDNVFHLKAVLKHCQSSEIEEITQYLTSLPNDDPYVYYFLEGLKDSLNYFQRPRSAYSLSGAKMSDLLANFKLESREEWTNLLYTNCVDRGLLGLHAVNNETLSGEEGAYIYGMMVLL